MNQVDILAEKVLDDILEETVLEMQRWVSLALQPYESRKFSAQEGLDLCYPLSSSFLYLTSYYLGRIVTGEYWPKVVAVRTERSEFRTNTTEGQYYPVRLEQAKLVNNLSCGTRKQENTWLISGKEIPTEKKKIGLLRFTSRIPCHKPCRKKRVISLDLYLALVNHNPQCLMWHFPIGLQVRGRGRGRSASWHFAKQLHIRKYITKTAEFWGNELHKDKCFKTIGKVLFLLSVATHIDADER